MKIVKKTISLIISLLFLLTMAVFSATAQETGEISGDETLFVLDKGAICVRYALLDAGGNTVSGASYSLSGDENLSEYAAIDDSGMLYLDASALGKRFTITAKSGSVTAQKTVQVSHVCYCTDFEDTEQIKAVFGNRFDMELLQTENGNTYASFADTEAAMTKLILPDFRPQQYTITGRESVRSMVAQPGSKNVFKIRYQNVQNDAFTSLFFERAGTMVNWGMKCDQWSNGGRIALGSFEEFDSRYADRFCDFVITVNDSSKINYTYDGVQVYQNRSMYPADALKDGAEDAGTVAYFSLGGRMDDFKIFSGTRASGAALPNCIPDTVYFTEDCDEDAVLPLDDAVRIGSGSFSGKISYTSDAVIENGRLHIPKGNGDITVTARSDAYDLEQTYVIHREIISSAEQNLAGGAEKPFDRLTGRLFLTFQTEEALSVDLKMQGGSVPLTASAPAESAQGVIVLDTLNKRYTAIFDGKALAHNAALPAGGLTGLANRGGELKNVSVSTTRASEPFALNPCIDGVSAVGQELAVQYVYYSPSGAAEKSADITWYAADSENGSYTKVGSGKTWMPEAEHANKYVKFEIVVSDGVLQSPVAVSDPLYIEDIFTVTRSGDQLSLEVQNYLGVDAVYAAFMFYSGGVLQKTAMERVGFYGGNGMLDADATGFDGVSVVLLYTDTLKPVSLPKALGNVPNASAAAGETDDIYYKDGVLYLLGQPNTMASVLIYGHDTDEADPTVCDRVVYTRDDILAQVGKSSISQKLYYVSGCMLDGTGKAALRLPEAERGSYRVELILKSGKGFKKLIMVKPEEALAPQVMNYPGFCEVYQLYSGKTETEAKAVYAYYSALSSNAKEKAADILESAGYDICEFDLAAMLVNYLEGNTKDKTLSASLTKRLDEKKISTEGLRLMQYDADPKATGEKAFSMPWKNAEELIGNVDDIAILYGVAHVKVYMEADPFLKALDGTDYAQSKYQSDICQTVAGTLYSSLDALRKAVNGYRVSEGGSSSGSGSSGGGSSRRESGATISTPSMTAPTVRLDFSDVNTDFWASESIYYLKERGVVSGRPDGSFAPDDTITRAEFIKILCEAFGLTGTEEVEFSDVAADSWMHSYTAKAGGLGIIKGDDGRFMPNNQITREDAAVLLYRVLQHKGITLQMGSNDAFEDSKEISDYALSEVLSLAAAKLINGMDGASFCPRQSMTRAQCAQLVANTLRGYSL